MIALAVTAAEPAPIGDAILHYVRSNRDGSLPEHVVHFRPTRTGIAVYKWVEKCTTAAYVTAEMNGDLRDGRSFVAGKVSKDGTQATFGTLTLDPARSALIMDVKTAAERIQETHPLKSRPFLIYDFDFADLNAYLQEARPTADFAFEMPTIWPVDGPTLFRDFGVMRAKYRGNAKHGGRDAVRFDLTVEGPTPSSGSLWVDADQGFIVEADLGLPNHLEYRDFRLKLERVETGGQAAWNALTRGHYANCPTGN